MARWEYTTLSWFGNPESIEELAKLGWVGWEVVLLLPGADLLLLKRAIPEENE